ncbi:MAG: hypothetical protein IJ829_06515, partial [Kiritimatiellae bacterium]|nr:hypothetical protein [Kiritimatiellia bacterium]
ARAAQIRVVRNAATKRQELAVDTSRGRTNLSALRLAYSPKTGLFKGTFKIYALDETAAGRLRLKRYTAKVNGVVYDGEGVGEAAVARPAAGLWTVRVK